MKTRKFKKGDILFVESEVMILLDGLVFMKGHTDEILEPKMLAKFQQGDIIGCKKIDNGVSNKVETWCIANLPTEVAIFDPKDFDFIWSHHKESKTETLVKILKTHSLFNLLSDQTIYLLAYELIKVRKYTPGTLVIAQSKRSSINYCYREFFETRMASLQLDMIVQRNRIREQCEEENVSMFSALMEQIHRKEEAHNKLIRPERVVLYS